ncbi:hypothetical protein [Nocardia arthritidis]|uniref:Plasmid replication, integration and excision activator n=1 Tax=Nocardia arthritidis TaxID=228602 RepID=A0A6G9Y7U7_9NOCA|nr:hypothetical protein [Nocardia arthritidis]QIS09292.1 hypothetical protein F5544_06910 [Nocardia arthritidis]
MPSSNVWLRAEASEFFPKGTYLFGSVQPVTEFQRDRNTPAIQKVDLDYEGKGTGKRLWKATITDPSGAETNAKHTSYDVIFVADTCPVPPAVEIAPGVTPVELEGLMVKPRLIGSGEFKSIGWTVRATGFKGDKSGSVAPGDHSAAAPRNGKAAA